MIQAQYDAAVQNPPWEQSNTFDIDDRPKKKRKQWYYEVVAPDGKVVDVIDEETAPTQDSQPDLPRRSSRSRSSNTTTPTSRASTPPMASSSSSLSSCSSRTPEIPKSFSQSTFDADTSTMVPESPTRRTVFPAADSFDINDSFSTSDSSSQESQVRPSASQNPSSSRQSLPNLKGRDLFDSMVWQDAFTTSIFYMFISSLRQKVKDVASTTESHKFLRVLRDSGRLVRNYSQNIDMLEEREGLCMDLSQGSGSRSRFSRIQRDSAGESGGRVGGGGCESVALHGTLLKLRCSICTRHSDWDVEDRTQATLSGTAPDCPDCSEYSTKRTDKGRRGIAIGRLRPDIVLYGEEHPSSNLIAPLVTHDLALGPDVLLIMGTSLRVHGLKIMVKEFAKAVHTRGGKVVFVNRTKPSESTWGDVIDYWVEWDCDEWVLDLKKRREDIWVPHGAIKEERRQSTGETVRTTKFRPQCTREDKINAVYVLFKILDLLRKADDSNGRSGDRLPYWVAPTRVSIAPIAKTAASKPPQRKLHKKATTKEASGQTTLTKSKKRKSAPESDDKLLPHVTLGTTNYWDHLLTIAPSLPSMPIYLQRPYEKMGNRPHYPKPDEPKAKPSFPFNGMSNHMPNYGWALSKVDLISHPPSGAGDIPIHSPTPEERRFAAQKAAEKIKPPERKITHGYHTRASGPQRRLSTADTIVVGSGDVQDASVVLGDTIVVEEEVNDSRIKRSCSIGAICSSPEVGDAWFDAKEVL